MASISELEKLIVSDPNSQKIIILKDIGYTGGSSTQIVCDAIFSKLKNISNDSSVRIIGFEKGSYLSYLAKQESLLREFDSITNFIYQKKLNDAINYGLVTDSLYLSFYDRIFSDLPIDSFIYSKFLKNNSTLNKQDLIDILTFSKVDKIYYLTDYWVKFEKDEKFKFLLIIANKLDLPGKRRFTSINRVKSDGIDLNDISTELKLNEFVILNPSDLKIFDKIIFYSKVYFCW